MGNATIPLNQVKGIGPSAQEKLQKLEIETVAELFDYFPFRYETNEEVDLSVAPNEARVNVVGEIVTPAVVSYFGQKRNRLSFKLKVAHLVIQITFFNQGYLKAKLNVGDSIRIIGKWDRQRQAISASKYAMADETTATVDDKKMEPVYSMTEGVKQSQFQKWLRTTWEQYQHTIEEYLPPTLINRYQLLNRHAAYEAIHFPTDLQQLKQARRRYTYEELLLFQLKLQLMRQREKEQSGGISIKYEVQALRTYIASLPFELTGAQKRVVNEICGDLLSATHMNRLLQGDVGSGKTVVASIAIFATVNAGYQAALMVPTEILAEQHFAELTRLLTPFGIEVALLTGSTKAKNRRVLHERMASGALHVLIGTHALIQDDVVYHRLGLVVTDEQHRFGVKQRRAFREKGEQPDVLFMTATPIPRTLAITVFGEMDVSVINELPAGRKPIETRWFKHEQMADVLAFTRREIAEGRQVYMVAPLIEESENMDLQNAFDLHAQMQQYFGAAIPIGLMHGRLKAVEKEEVMHAFEADEIKMLVTTTVIEVGVNVPNASTMIIYDAERFGLSQLHQLRGRVGRGGYQSYCFLIADPKSENGKERMQIMTESNDGFVISQRDLELRGAGDFFGNKQSGVPQFKVADLVEDYRVLEVARTDAIQIISERLLTQPDYERLAQKVQWQLQAEATKID
ncbi:ATP-dependent DNA helicase RecG [Brochothrix campestris]|uniref:ATP-dependent DNA helicase RecG n=1 Tax=Brochothrix campestris FSL F6-1037 TaxID=1265861 RepID=W7D9C7_9LIST|nr:ATP-dependent DNA helicase RecG [Brochothrix campestris]EUJ41848.1 ATP-dependent DNA helicase RecG [Brochothrix campestris FSL F6-1037]